MSLHKKPFLYLLALLALSLAACARVPDGVTPLPDFDVARYQGTWYEVMRLDHSYERGLVAVSATYTLNPDGTLRVVNRGLNPRTCTWKEAVGHAKFHDDPHTARLSVSFFWPFYAGYSVFALDHDGYAWAAVAGPTHDYLWILSRTPDLPDETREHLIDAARTRGFPTDDLIRVKQDPLGCKTPTPHGN